MVDIAVGILPEKQNQWGIDRQMYIYIVEFSQVTVEFGWTKFEICQEGQQAGSSHKSTDRIPCFRKAWFYSEAHG